MVGIIDFNAGNITSLERALDYLKIPYIRSKNPSELKDCDRFMFPRFAEKVYIRAIRELMEQGKYDQFDNPQQVFHWWISNQNSKEWLFKHNQPKLF